MVNSYESVTAKSTISKGSRQQILILLFFFLGRNHSATGFVFRRFQSHFAALMASTAQRSTSDSTTNERLSVSWRTIPKPTSTSEKPQVRHDRTEWNRESYQEALEFYQQLVSCQDSYVKGAIESALHALSHAYRLYGPDCVVRALFFCV